MPRSLLAPIAALTFAIGVGWCQEQIGTIDLMTGNRSCGAAPRPIAAWAFTRHTRRPEERASLQEWVARHPRSINSWYKQCQTPLHIAARFNREISRWCFWRPAPTRTRLTSTGIGPLHVAADHGNADVARVLLERDAEVDARGAGGRTPLHAAAQGITDASDIEGQPQVARLLLARGADVNAKAANSGSTPLRSAASAGRAMVDLLQANGAR